MGYPVYKLIRAVNRQYPNNGFINYVDVREDMYDTDDPETNKVIDEDLRDLINEAIHETYIHIARDEVFSFPTVAGQNQYQLPEDCDLRDIQEVTRTFRGVPIPPPPPVEPGPGPDPQYDHTVMFMVSTSHATLSHTEGTELDNGTVFYTVPNGDCVPEVPTVNTVDGYIFIGWSPDGETIVPVEDILQTQVLNGITYTGIFEEDEDMKSIITVSRSTNFTGDGANEVPFDVSDSVGNGFSLDNDGYIVIGAGISKVLISGEVTIRYGADGAKIFSLFERYDGATTKAGKFDPYIGEGEYNVDNDVQIVFAPVLMDVHEGGKIVLSVNIDEGDTIYGNDLEHNNRDRYKTHITVEEVKVSSGGNPLGGNNANPGTTPDEETPIDQGENPLG